VGPGPRVRDWAIVFGGDEEAHYRGRRFAPRVTVRLLCTRRPALQLYDLWTRPPCHRLGCLGARRAGFSAASRGASGRVSLEKGFTPRAAVTLSHYLPIVAPFRLRALRAPLRSCSPAFRRCSRHGLASSSRAFPVRGGTQPGAQPARMERAGVR
jgi:hypothetical protein